MLDILKAGFDLSGSPLAKCQLKRRQTSWNTSLNGPAGQLKKSARVWITEFGQSQLKNVQIINKLQDEVVWECSRKIKSAFSPRTS